MDDKQRIIDECNAHMGNDIRDAQDIALALQEHIKDCEQKIIDATQSGQNSIMFWGAEISKIKTSS